MKRPAFSLSSLRVGLVLRMAIGASLAAHAAEPANPSATPQVRTVLNYFHELSARKPHGSQNPPGNYDYRRFIDGLEKEFPTTCFFMCWNAKWSLATNENTKELLAHPSIVNREDLPAKLFKTSP